MTGELIEPSFSGSNLIKSLEHALRMAKNGELSLVMVVGTNRHGEYTIGGLSGDIDRTPLMSMIGELEHQKLLLLEKIER